MYKRQARGVTTARKNIENKTSAKLSCMRRRRQVKFVVVAVVGAVFAVKYCRDMWSASVTSGRPGIARLRCLRMGENNVFYSSMEGR